MLGWAIGFIFSALICYTIGVWSQRISGRLQGWHVALFWVGLLTDTAGTTVMGKIAGGLVLNVHGSTGLVAIVLMAIHTVWATAVLAGGRERALRSFHRFSVFVWVLWLVPFVSGMILAPRM